jgi:Tol biopolymer transport system component
VTGRALLLGLVIVLFVGAVACTVPTHTAPSPGVSTSTEVTPSGTPAPHAGGAIAFISTRGAGLYVVNRDGTGLYRLPNSGGVELDATWSSDGRKIAFAGVAVGTKPGDPDIWVMNADGTGVTQLTNSHQVDVSPAWSHDGKRIAFARGLNRGISAVHVMNADGTNVIRLSQGAEPFDLNPVWLPGDQAIAFSSYAGPADVHRVIYSIDPDGSNQRQLLSDPKWSYLALAPAPDGGRLAVEALEDNGSGVNQIFLLEPGHSPAQLTRNGGTHPRWSPDGKEIAFDTTRDGPHRIYVMNADGSDQTAVSTGVPSDKFDIFMNWTPA